MRPGENEEGEGERGALGVNVNVDDHEERKMNSSVVGWRGLGKQVPQRGK